MAKQRVTKAEQILRELVQDAHGKVVELQGQLDVAMATHNAHFEALARLQQARDSKPQKKPKKAPAIPPGLKEVAPDKEAKCGICGNVKDHSDHDRNYIKSHDFEPAKAATRKRSRKAESTTDTGAEVETETALTTSAGRD